MARNKIIAVAVIAGCFLSACNRDGLANNDQSKIKISGTFNPADFYHPRIIRPGMMKVAGCCTFDAGQANVERLNGDSSIIIVRGVGFETDIVFGFYEQFEKSMAKGRKRIVIDGITLESFLKANQDAMRSKNWQASVPLTAAASARGVADPVLKISGKCQSDTGCKAMEDFVNSIRF